MLHQLWHQINVPLRYALPVFMSCIAVEAVAVKAHGHGEVSGYLAKDSRTSISMGFGSLVFTGLFKLATLVLFVFLWAYAAPWHIPSNTWWSWLLLMVVIDFAWYCNHRFSHRVRIGWAAHQAHHSASTSTSAPRYGKNGTPGQKPSFGRRCRCSASHRGRSTSPSCST